jgi:DNA-binding MarR family transcriptional regulator
MSQTLSNFLLAVEEVRKLSPEMPAVRLSILLLVAETEEGLTYREIMDITGLSNSSVSRNVNALSETDRHGEPGMGLVLTVTDPNDWRRKAVVLSRQGKAMVRKLLLILNKG